MGWQEAKAALRLIFNPLGIVGADHFSKQGKADRELLFSKAQHLVRSLSEIAPDINVLRGLRERGVAVELIVGPSQEREQIDQMTALGISVTQSSWKIRQSMAIVDGTHVLATEPIAKGLKEQPQWIMLNAPGLAVEVDAKFENVKERLQSEPKGSSLEIGKEEKEIYICSSCKSAGMKYKDVFDRGVCRNCSHPAGDDFIHHVKI